MEFFKKLFKKDLKESVKLLSSKQQPDSIDEAIVKIDSEMMDSDEFRDMVTNFIWHDDMKGLRELCDNKFIMTELFTEKVIEEIAPRNTRNDGLFLIARKLIEANPDRIGHLQSALQKKRKLVKNPDGGKEVMKPFVNVELSPDDFLKKLKLILSTHTFLGLDDLIQSNPHNTWHFINQWIETKSGAIDTNTRFFQLVCEMAKLYRNLHHKSDLLNLIIDVAGTLCFMKGEDDNVPIRLIKGTDIIYELQEIAKKAKVYLVKGEYSNAIQIYKDLIPKMNTLFANTIPMGSSEYENSLLFYGILLAMKDRALEAQDMFMKCAEKRYHYGELLLFSPELIKANADILDAAFRKTPVKSANDLSFDSFFKLASGQSYFDVNRMYDKFCVFSGDREMNEAFRLSENLKKMYLGKRNKLVKFSLCEYLTCVFRTCYLIMQGELEQARQEYIQSLQNEVAPQKELEQRFDSIVKNPEELLDHYFGS